MDKVQKIRERVVEIVNSINPFIPDEDGKNSDYEAGKLDVATQILQIIDSLEEPASGLDNGDMPIERWKQAVKAASNQRNYRSSKGLTETRDDYFVDGVQWADEHPKEEPVSNDFEMALAEMIDKAQASVVEPLVIAAQWKDELIKLAKSEEPVSEDLEEAAKKYATEGDEISGLYIIDEEVEAFKAGANWQKQQIMNGAVDGTAQTYLPFESIRFIGKPLRELGLKTNNPVKVIIIKEN